MKRLLISSLAAAILLGQPAFAPAEPAQAVPTAQPTTTQRLTFKQLSGQAILPLRSTEGRRIVTFGSRADELVTRAVLRVRYTYSPALIPGQSHIRVLLNDETVGVVPITKEDAGRTVQREIEIDPRYFADFNRLQLQFIGHYTQSCEDPLHSSLWADVSGSSELEITTTPLPQKSDLALLPEPFFDKRDLRRLTLPFVFAATPSWPITMLGIVIGVAAVIAVVALGNGAQKQINDRIVALGTTLLTINPGQGMQGGVRTGGGGARLTTNDAQALVDRGTRILAVQPEIQGNLQVVFGNKNTNSSIIGTTANYPEVRKFEVEYGRFFTHSEDQTRQRVAVIGPAVAENLGLGSGLGLVGETVRIRGIQFTVVGALKSKGAGGGFGNPDDQVLIPVQTARFRVLGNNRVRSIGVLAPTEADIPETMADIQQILRREHHLRPGRDDDFQIRSQTDFLNTLSETSQTFGLLLAGIAAVSLVVGGIGIMNIMLVSVTERTREIGVRKALGATRLNIMFQFLIEAVVLCLVGGAIGIAFGTGGATLFTRNFGWTTAIGVDSIMIAFGFSAFVGVVFGVYPARRAAVMDPITALRYE